MRGETEEGRRMARFWGNTSGRWIHRDEGRGWESTFVSGIVYLIGVDGVKPSILLDFVSLELEKSI
jgi:hypothetical protein